MPHPGRFGACLAPSVSCTITAKILQGNNIYCFERGCFSSVLFGVVALGVMMSDE